jgi:molybdenum cofactor synthesis domain-containing protein
MLKPIDKGVEIYHIKLVTKKGGKSDVHKVKSDVNAAVIVCSDSISKGSKEDFAGKAIMDALKKWGISSINYEIIPDEIDSIQKQLRKQHQSNRNLIIFTGGTGLSPRDQTPEALAPFLDKKIPGMEEAIRNFGQDRTPYAMLSRSVAGMYGDSLVLALPGSTQGAIESMHALFPAALHLFDILKGAQHKK